MIIWSLIFKVVNFVNSKMVLLRKTHFIFQYVIFRSLHWPTSLCFNSQESNASVKSENCNIKFKSYLYIKCPWFFFLTITHESTRILANYYSLNTKSWGWLWLRGVIVVYGTLDRVTLSPLELYKGWVQSPPPPKKFDIFHWSLI